jgi:hypothetical protein
MAFQIHITPCLKTWFDAAVMHRLVVKLLRCKPVRIPRLEQIETVSILKQERTVSVSEF